MSAHLTHEELTNKLLGVSSLTVNGHLLNCPACANELELMKSSIADFRGAAHAWSQGAVAEGRTVSVASTPQKSFWTANWALVAVAVILFAAGFGFYLRDYQSRSQSSSIQPAAAVTSNAAAQAQIAKDNELLSQVNSELAEAVPAPMQPLRLLDSTASSASTTK